MKPDTSLSPAAQDTMRCSAIKKILYATDLSAEAPKGFHYALSLARQFGAEVTSLHVLDKHSPEADLILAKYFSREQRKELSANNLQQALEEMLHRDSVACSQSGTPASEGECQQTLGVTSINRVVYGKVEEEILACSAHLNPDLIILGAHETFRNRSSLSTVAKRVISRSKVPVTIVPIPGSSC
ncbi:universal stress protein [Desulfogranum mediterraneum]|uniref:universal stress protein n=1 Tax=Desulfogranum mediterraneum TaxID=160661 RepID=UPI0004079696|nr:universal stress protein [Desulfogranum mediterraneum]